jgi:hypothetical protein
MIIADTLQQKGAIVSNVTTTTTSYSVLPTDSVIICNNGTTAITITLPAANTSKGVKLYIKRFSSQSRGVITLSPLSGSIESATAFTFAPTAILGTAAANRRLVYMSDGINWHCII